jgi:FkbM family methyltransferase
MFIKSLIDVFSNYHHARIVRYLKRNNLNFSKYVDIGTHEGELLEHILKLDIKKVFCVEPQTLLYKALKKKFKKAKVYNYALDKKISKKYFFINKLDGTSTLSKFNENSFFLKFKNFILQQKNNFEKKTIIKTSTMDHLFKSIVLNKTLLKIDVEGYEINVLKGAKKKLKEVSYILIEHQFGNHYKNVNFAKVDKYLKDNNFRVLKDFYFPTLHFKDILYIKDK